MDIGANVSEWPLIAPRTVVELFKLLMLFDKEILPGNNTRKCMTEGRPDCAGTYKGFVYARGMAEGKEIRRILRQLVTDEISTHFPVSLKHGCSEYAYAWPQFAEMKPGRPLPPIPQVKPRPFTVAGGAARKNG